MAIVVGMIAGLLLIGKPLTPELLARTQPTLLDLGIALFSGMAGAYALCRSDAAGALPGVAIAAALVPPLATVGITFTAGYYPESIGALLLYTTNFVAISSAAALVFVILGFRPSRTQKNRRTIQARSVRVAVTLLLIIAGLLAYTTYRLAEETAEQNRIYEVTEQMVAEIAGAELAEFAIVQFDDGFLQLEIVVRSPHAIPYSVVTDLQENIGVQLTGEEIVDELAMTMTVIKVTQLDPLVPPTPTITPTVTNTPTPGPTLTVTPTVTAVPTKTPTPSATPTIISTNTTTPTLMPTVTGTSLPTHTPTQTPIPTATAVTAVIASPYGLNLRADAGQESEILSFLEPDTIVVILPGQKTVDSLTWRQVEADGGRWLGLG